MIINNYRELDRHSHLRMFIAYTGVWLQHVSARIGHCQVKQVTTILRSKNKLFQLDDISFYNEGMILSELCSKIVLSYRKVSGGIFWEVVVVCVCVCLGFVMCGCVYVWVL